MSGHFAPQTIRLLRQLDARRPMFRYEIDASYSIMAANRLARHATQEERRRQ